MPEPEEYTAPPGFRIPNASGTVKLQPVLIDPAAPADEGDVITRVGSGYAPTAPSGGGGGVAVPLSVINSHAIEVLAIDDLGGTTHRQESGQNFSILHAAEDVNNAHRPFEVGDSGITFNLSDFFNSVLEIRSRGSTSRRLLQAGWNESGEIILGFAAGKVGFFGTAGVTRPQVPASPTVQDVVDALKALGLITQAS